MFNKKNVFNRKCCDATQQQPTAIHEENDGNFYIFSIDLIVKKRNHRASPPNNRKTVFKLMNYKN